MVRYYGHYSNVGREECRKAEADDVIPCILEPGPTTEAFRRNRAPWIQRIYEIDPLVCPKCTGTMRAIAFIEQADVIRKIFEHLGLGCSRCKAVPMANAPPMFYVSEHVEGCLPTMDNDIVDPIGFRCFRRRFRRAPHVELTNWRVTIREVAMWTVAKSEFPWPV